MAVIAPAQAPIPAPQPIAGYTATPANKNVALLSVLKDEMFELESERIAGTVSSAEYAEQKAALEIVLKRALKKKQLISGQLIGEQFNVGVADSHSPITDL